MSALLVIAGKSFRRNLTYRAATLAGLATNLFFGIVRAYTLLAAARASGGMVAGYTPEQLLSYTAWTQALIACLPIFAGWDLMLAVSSGEVVSELCRPISLYRSWQAADLGRALQGVLFRGVPLLVGYALFFPLWLPKSPVVWAFFLVSLVMAELIGYAWRFTVNCIAFWTLQARGFMGMLFAVAMFLMGHYIPLEFLPTWFQKVTAWTPFPQMVQRPIQIITGRVTAVDEMALILLVQGLWVIVMWAVVGLVFRAGTRKLVVQGG